MKDILWKKSVLINRDKDLSPLYAMTNLVDKLIN